MDIAVLVDRYPAIAGQIQEAARRGFTAEDIQASINRATQYMEPAKVYQMLTGRTLAPPEDPGIMKRIGASLLRGATFGLAGPQYAPDPYASVTQAILTDLAPELVGGFAPIGIIGGAMKALGFGARAARGLSAARDAETFAPAVTQTARAARVVQDAFNPQELSQAMGRVREMASRPLPPTSLPKPLAEPPTQVEDMLSKILQGLLTAGAVGGTLYATYKTGGGME